MIPRLTLPNVLPCELRMTVEIGASSRDSIIVAACVVLPTISTIFILLRILLRIYVLRSLGWDDC